MKKLVILILTGILSWVQAQDTLPPEWAKDAVWYQVFVERFYNGDPSNDPKKEDLKGAWPNFVPENWGIAPWTKDWYASLPWEPFQDFYKNTALRRYGGDLQGVINKLPYLKELGVSAIYLNPIFESPSHHKYDCAMYRHIDNNFGPDPETDREIWSSEDPANPATWKWTTADSLFLKFIQKAHKMGIKIIIDGVFNHVGSEFWAFKHVKKYGNQSPFKNWFYIKQFDDPATPENEFDYEGWYGVKSLPELKEKDGELIEPIRNHLFHIIERWMDPNGDGNPEDGIDGWRLDVADMVGHSFWKRFRKKVKSINPDAYITGEVWWDDYSRNKVYNAKPWLGEEFDAVMNYRFLKIVKRFIADHKLAISSLQFQEEFEKMMRDYNENMFVMQNLIDSHDIERFSSTIVNPDHWMDHGGRPDLNQNWQIRKPTSIEYEKLKLAVALQFTLPGAPMIYYGDEAGMWGGDDPDCRKPMVWPEFSYEPERHHPSGENRPVDSVEFNDNVFKWYKLWTNLRQNLPALRRGTVHFIRTGNKNVLMFTRSYKNQFLLIVLNRSESNERIQMNFSGKRKDLITGRIIPLKKSLELDPLEVMIFEMDKEDEKVL
jgi:glycosidase